ncbi:MAG: N-glycosylase/DNA lyase [Methanobacteriota archaeon]
MPIQLARANEVELKSLYASAKKRIVARLGEFERMGQEGTDEQLFAELAFCLLTPQSKAKSCWAAVCRLVEEGDLLCGKPEKISGRISGVRFHRNKGRYLVEAQRRFSKNGSLRVRNVIERFDSPRELRAWLVQNVSGMGYKEASHFLRNIGMGSELAILDRHILRNMAALGAIDGIPRALTPKAYLALEKEFLALAKRLRIPPDHLDMLLWYKEAGEVFK